MPVRFNACIEKVEANVGRVAVTRGPLVYCAEEAGNGGLVQRPTSALRPRQGTRGTGVLPQEPTDLALEGSPIAPLAGPAPVCQVVAFISFRRPARPQG